MVENIENIIKRALTPDPNTEHYIRKVMRANSHA